VLANVRLVGVNVSGAVPIPDKATDCGLVDELLATVREDMRFPRAEGINVTLMLQLCPPGSVLGLSGQFPPKVKSDGAFPPVIVMPSMVMGVFWEFLNVAVWDELVSPTARLPNDKLTGVNLVCEKTGKGGRMKAKRAKIAP
jgi:hypothetical protein